MSLAHLRFDSAASQGRTHPEKPHPYRDAFQRDRDRVIHSRAFRRLQDKTQVFTAPPSDHFRTRLTHSIEVAQISRTVAAALDLNQDLVEALALAHDLGHPPFGHAGESALDEEMRKHGASFNHNEHALRVVDRFEQRYADFPGLNLTFEVREGLLKHSRDYSAVDFPEFAEFELDKLPCLEAQLIDPADEIAYNCADLDDAVEAKLVTLDELGEALPEFSAFTDEARRRNPDAHRFMTFNEALRRLLDTLVSGLIEGTLAAATEVGARDAADVRTAGRRLAEHSTAARELSAKLKAFLNARVYRSAVVRIETEAAAERVRTLFQAYVSRPEDMPRPYRRLAEAEGLHRAVCDYIAGMTDSFLLRRRGELDAGG